MRAWQEREPSLPARNLPNRFAAMAACIKAFTALAQAVKSNKSQRVQGGLMREFVRLLALMVYQYPQRSISRGIATNYPPGPCTRCTKLPCRCPPGEFKWIWPTIKPEWLRESVYSIQVRMRKTYHGGNMLNGGRWNVLSRTFLEIHEALDNDLQDLAREVALLAAGEVSRLNADPDGNRDQDDLLHKDVEFGDVALWLAVLANALDLELATHADPAWDATRFVYPDETPLARGEFEEAEASE